MKRTGSLFHAIVVVGAALGAACGDDENLPPADSPPADVVVADARVNPDAPADGSQIRDAAPMPDGDAMPIIL